MSVLVAVNLKEFFLLESLLVIFVFLISHDISTFSPLSGNRNTMETRSKVINLSDPWEAIFSRRLNLIRPRNRFLWKEGKQLIVLC